MYTAHFGLTKPPFKITPDTRVFYSGGERGSVLEALSYVVMSGEGITKVIGEVGAGKTMLCRMLEEKLPQAQVDSIYIANPSISPENILNVLAFEVGLTKQPISKLEAMQLLQNWLLEKHAANRYVVVLIEEAQGMPLETLEEIRLLSNLETEQGKLLQIVLFGQPELDIKLNDNSIRQLKERIAHNFYLSPLNRVQIKEYLNFRLRSAGYHGPDLFDDRAARQIERYSRGLIRRINILADKILLAAYAAGTTQITPKLIKKAAADCQFSSIGRYAWLKKLWLPAGIGMAAGLLLAGLVWWFIVPGTTTSKSKPLVKNETADTLEKRPVAGSTAPLTIKAVTEPIHDAQAVQAVYEPANRQANPETSDGTVESFGQNDSIAVKDPDISAQESAFEQGGLQMTQEAGITAPEETARVADTDSLSDNTTTPLTNSTIPAAYTNLVNERLKATWNWLNTPGPAKYSIQLMTLKSDSTVNLNSYLKELPKTIELSDIFIYETQIGGEPMYGVLYQLFKTRDEAQARLKNMPPTFQSFEPFLLRTVQGLRSEIARSSS